MSLTSFISLPDVKQKFRTDIPLPNIVLSGDMIAPPMTTNYGLVGTAFDYLMRFFLEKLNPNCVKKDWVAVEAVEMTKDVLPIFKITSRSLLEAKKHYSGYIKSGIMGKDVFRAALLLAQLDPIYRAGHIDENIGNIEEGDIKDLQNLIQYVNPDLFKAKSYITLNPTFGEGSELVGGADADFVIDGILVDIKTTKYLQFTREHFNQLVGYYILSKVGFIHGMPKKANLSSVGIYYSRYGILKTIPIELIEGNPKFKDFSRWFESRAKLDQDLE